MDYFTKTYDNYLIMGDFNLEPHDERLGYFLKSLLNSAPWAPSRLRALPVIDTHLTRLRAYASYPSLIRACAPLLTNKCLTRLFLSCVVVSVVRYALRLKNPRKVTGPDFIPLKFIKFASNVIDSQFYNIIRKDLEKNKYSDEPKTALVRPIFKKNERNNQDKKL